MPGGRDPGVQLLPSQERTSLLTTAAGGLSAATTALLDEYARLVLACAPRLARSGGVHVVAAPARGLPAWHGYVLPVVGLALPEGAVFAVRPDLAEPLCEALGSDARRQALDGAALSRAHRAIRRLVPHAYTLVGAMRAVEAATFTPTASVDRAELIPRDDPAGLDLRRRFDGEVFGVRGPRGRLVSWAALKRKSERVWEIAVATEADYRGRGYGRDVVAAATAFTLAQGRVPLYVHDYDNSTSAFVARSLGYLRYAEVVLAEY